MTARLKEFYRKEVIGALARERGYKNPLQAPRLLKIVLNTCIGTEHDRDALKAAAEDIARIAGQRPVITKARKSISNFKLREGMNIGAKVTLRGDRMYEFLERFIGAALPRIRDFRGVSPRGFDGHGNYTLGVKDHTVFPEVNPDQAGRTHGLDVTFVTSAASDEEARDLLQRLGLPFAK